MSHDNNSVNGMTMFGFWVYIMTDCMIFAMLFATYAVLYSHTYGGPGASELVDLPFVFVETMLLLTSSFTFGLAMIQRAKSNVDGMMKYLALTAALGISFVAMEIYEFNHLCHEGYCWSNSAYLSSFFALVGTHGLHVTCGIVWLLMLMFQVKKYGLDGTNHTRLACLGLFWHFLDVVWVILFTFVYLIGAI